MWIFNVNVYLLVQILYDYEEIWDSYKFYGVFSSKKKAEIKAKELNLKLYSVLRVKVDE